MSWTGFVVLPDSDAAGEVRAVVPFASPRVFPHASGRPWLIGHWPLEDLVMAEAGPMRVAVIGSCPVTADNLAARVKRVRSVDDVDAIATELPGSFHVVASIDGRVRVQGSVTGLRRVFHARRGRVPLAADRADVLAAMTGAGIDERMLAVRVACSGKIPPPLGDQPLWSGISALPADHYLTWHHDREYQVRWWRPPPPQTPLGEGALAVREALSTATDHRAPSGGRLSCDLSGGMDSTSLAFLAARTVPDLLTYRNGEAEAGNDDTVFAAVAIEALENAEHLVVGQQDLPALFTDVAVPVGAETPYAHPRTVARKRHIARLLAERGSRRHLAGHGGDELFTPLPGYLHRLLWRHPLTAWRHVRGYAALRRWPLGATLRNLLLPGDVAKWWQAQADNLTGAAYSGRQAVLGWGLWPLRASAWVTGAAVDLARQELSRAAQYATPLALDPGQHQAVLTLRTNSAHYRQLARLYAEGGVRLELPYFDDRVAEAVLAVRPHEHAGPFRYKPLLAEAMRGLVPDAVLGRTTKGEFGEDVRVGLRRNLPAILKLFADSALADRGLIDADALREHLTAPQPVAGSPFPLEHLIGCEIWLRAATQPVPRSSDASATAS
ncbi:lasso peptide isopeptide bond-forming cyclase [Saccharopolyspora erythraea]|uniref:lasso peptide isopeptide bond-forming cyclase n=1 Tax=Saccharopolyspora erythraea TaxID=1836 RepID=UPI001BA5CD22|nr:lasso peptide isopeptide bond-forming cyclase [Saccharopolyspora erythraea]QUH00861.1 lasso peptide isopeptide bond-forming cyclase [Saccharopolyspora erythraea]